MNKIEIEPILRAKPVLNITGDSQSGLYAKMADGTFPRPVRIGLRSVGWPAGDVAAINAARIAGKSDAEIRALVAKLHAARKAAA